MAGQDDQQPSEDPVLRSLKLEVHLLKEELSGLREMLEGVTSALSGAQKAYGAVAMRADLLEKRMDMTLSRPRIAPVKLDLGKKEGEG